MSAIAVSGLTKEYRDGRRVVDALSFEVATGELLALLGPSGCGKTTTLRMVAGLTRPTSGSVFLNGRDVSGLPPEKRNLGFVFQNYGLFPHMTVWDNVAYGLRLRRSADLAATVARSLRMVRLTDVERRYPGQLSGGQQQRVALARAIAIQPEAILLDEPLSNLDLELRTRLRAELTELQARTGWTAIFVTHDQTEALSMAHRVAVMSEGRIVQTGTPRELYEAPRTRFVASFVGETNLVEGVVQEGCFEFDSRHRVPAPGAARSGAVTLSIRPEHVRVLSEPEATGGLEGRVVTALYGGSSTRCTVELAGSGRRLLVDVPSPHRVEVASTVCLHWTPDAATCVED